MEKYKSYKEAVMAFEKFLDQPWKYRYKQSTYHLPLELYLGPTTPYLGIFNRLTQSENSYTFSYDDLADSEYINTFKSIFKINQTKYKATIEENDTVNPQYAAFKNTGNKILYVIRSIFSEGYVQTNKLDLTYVKSLLSKDENQENNLPELQGNDTDKDFVRLEEVIDDLRLVLLIMPQTGEMKMSYGVTVSSGGETLANKYLGVNDAEIFFNPVSAYIYSEFDYGMREYNRFLRKNGLDISEVQGYEMILYLNNEQSFFTEYNFTTFTKSINPNISRYAKESANNCKLQLAEILNLMILYIGKDFLGRLQLSPDDYLTMAPDQFYDKPQLQKLLPFLVSGNRAYIMPNYEITIEVKPVLVENYEGTHETILTSLEMNVLPFDPYRPASKERYLHPLLYSIDK
jgi:hypothetical protein